MGGRGGGDAEALGLEIAGDGAKLFVRGPELLGELLRGEPVVVDGGAGVSLGREELGEGGGLGWRGLKADGEREGLGDRELAEVDSRDGRERLGGTGMDREALRLERGCGDGEEAQSA